MIGHKTINISSTTTIYVRREYFIRLCKASHQIGPTRYNLLWFSFSKKGVCISMSFIILIIILIISCSAYRPHGLLADRPSTVADVYCPRPSHHTLPRTLPLSSSPDLCSSSLSRRQQRRLLTPSPVLPSSNVLYVSVATHGHSPSK
jgi:hypothetical protein